MQTLLALALPTLALAREITFPPVSPLSQQQHPLSEDGDHDALGPIDVSGALYGGLMTYANLPYVHCLAKDGEEVEAYDIAVLGAPFDTVGLFRFFCAWSFVCCCF